MSGVAAGLSKFASISSPGVRKGRAGVTMRPMKRTAPRKGALTAIWELARAGELRRATEEARALIAKPGRLGPDARAELHLVCASCAMRQARHAEALGDLDAAARAAESEATALHVEAWRAELAYFQGRYSAAHEIIDRVQPRLEARRDAAYAAFVVRTRIAILLARADYPAIAALADRALRLSEDSGDDYVCVQVLNILGAVHFDCATSKLANPHARSHLALIEPADAAPMEAEALEALRYFERAREVAERAGYSFAAWYVSGNIERLQILLGHADRAVAAMRRRLKVLQSRGATYDEIVVRSNLAWGLRTLGRHRDALHELDVALELARRTGTFNVLLEFLHYDRSVVLDALGRTAEAHASYRQYSRLVGAGRSQAGAGDAPPSTTVHSALEPFFLKRADRYILAHLDGDVGIERVALHCGVSWRTLQNAFTKFRGLTPVAHVRNLRLDRAREALATTAAPVKEVAARVGFQSPTTFALEYRKRFGVAPSRTRG